jgi:hypothetical protein
MKPGSTLILKIAVIVIGAAALAVAIFVLPAGIMSDNTGMYRPIFIGMYFPAIPFFIALFEAFKLLNYIDRNQAFSELSVGALKSIKYCGIAISVMYAVGLPFVFQVADADDAPGAIAIGLVIIFASFVVAIFAGVLQKLLRNAIDIKSENDLTV